MKYLFKKMTFLLVFIIFLKKTFSLTCSDQEISSLPFCNSDLPIKDRVADLLPRLNISEKISQMNMVGEAVPNLGMETFNYGG